MIQSMTGYASVEEKIKLKSKKDLQLNIEIKSLNSRFCEIICKLPPFLNSLEIELNRLVKKKLCRGKISINIKNVGAKFNATNFEVNLEVAKNYYSQINVLKKTLKDDRPISFKDLIHLQDVIQFNSDYLDKTDEKKIITIFEKALTAVVAERNKEGLNIKKDFSSRLKNCKSSITQIEKINKDVIKKIKVDLGKLEQEINQIKLENQAENLVKELNLEEQKKIQKTVECQKSLDKSDINEEIVRFSSHLKKISNLLENKTVEKGKLIDFTLQELLREINTIASKNSEFAISQLCIDVKLELEKIREQSQNVV